MARKIKIEILINSSIYKKIEQYLKNGESEIVVHNQDTIEEDKKQVFDNAYLFPVIVKTIAAKKNKRS